MEKYLAFRTVWLQLMCCALLVPSDCDFGGEVGGSEETENSMTKAKETKCRVQEAENLIQMQIYYIVKALYIKVKSDQRHMKTEQG